MTELKCPFTLVIRADQAGCSVAQQVTWREGPGVNCSSEAAWARCGALVQRLKDVGLPAFGVEDDPLAMPQAVLNKIQLGGLSGLQGLLGRASEEERDVHGLVGAAVDQFGSLESIPISGLTEEMTRVKLRRRRG